MRNIEHFLPEDVYTTVDCRVLEKMKSIIRSTYNVAIRDAAKLVSESASEKRSKIIDKNSILKLIIK